MGSSASAYYDDLDRMNELESMNERTPAQDEELKELQRIYED